MTDDVYSLFFSSHEHLSILLVLEKKFFAIELTTAKKGIHLCHKVSFVLTFNIGLAGSKMNNYGSVTTTKEPVSNNIEEGRTDAEIDESSALIGDKDGDVCIKGLQYVDGFREDDKMLWYQNLFNYLRCV